MNRNFLKAVLAVIIALSVGGYFWPPILWSLLVFVPLALVSVLDFSQKRHAIRRNFPLVGNLRYFFEFVRPELQQYFVESNQSGRPIPREMRSIAYQRAKGQIETVPFGTQRDVYDPNHEWVQHSMRPRKLSLDDVRVTIGGPDCQRAYSASILNISAMSYGSLSWAAIEALNKGASKGSFYHNTGEGAISPFHKRWGGDLVWQLGTGYFGCRTLDGQFNQKMFAEKSQQAQVKMIEIKISQGAKPGKGGMLPGSKVNAEVAEIRGVEVGKDVISPSFHNAFTTPKELLQFVTQLRELSDGKPIGFKLCVGRKSEFFAICKAMVETGMAPDFITVDGAEGGTGAAPLEFTNSVGMPLNDGLSFVHNTLKGFGLRDKITLIASGKVISSFELLTKIALGADVVNSARAMMLALGCIQALKCNTNHCPAGVATNNPTLIRGLHVPSKAERVARYHSETIHAFKELVGAMGYTSPTEVKRVDLFRRISDGAVRSYEDLYPSVKPGAYLDDANLPEMSNECLLAYRGSQAESFELLT